MKVIVKPHNISIESKEDFNKEEYNVQVCDFNFSEEFTEDLVKVALFTDTSGNTYKEEIERNICKVPAEVLKEIGRVILGVYAYKVEDNELKIRYSPDPDAFVVLEGSYIKDTENSEPITPSEIEQYEQILHNYIQEVNTILSATEEELEDVRTLKKDTEEIKDKTEKLYNQVKEDYDNEIFIPNIQIGNVDTLEPGSAATVSKNGSKAEPIFNFGIPEGEKGDCFYAIPFIDVETGVMMLDVTDDTDYITFDVTEEGYLEVIIGE